MIKYRTNNCGELSKKDVGKKVILSGWVDSLRAHGKIGFINIRDRYGITQLFLEGAEAKKIPRLSNESVIRVEGRVNKRPTKLVNKNMKTGEIEIKVSKLEVLSRAEQLPLQLNDYINTTEDTRLKYRYLDLRTDKLQKNLEIRHRAIQFIRNYLDKKGFLEITTPILTKSTPEGARDYIVPSRLHKGKFYALPQSPQQYKQLLMIAGFDKYFQIAPCFRDEAARAHRSPGEFYQLDLEMGFVKRDDVLNVIENLMIQLVKNVFPNKKISKIPFPRITFEEAMKKYKSDKPDVRKSVDNPNELAFAWVIDFPLFTRQTKKDFFHGSGKSKWAPSHHMFTMPKEEDIPLLDKNPGKVRSLQYDLVLNGVEVGGGSIRIHDSKIQEKIFDLIGFTEEQKKQFAHMLNAFKYGAPPHGGIAPGIDRLLMVIMNEPSIREIIAFPKNKDAKDLTMDAPSEVDEKQLNELGIKLRR